MVAWKPVRADEIKGTADRFAAQTFELRIPLRTNSGVKPMNVSVFVPRLLKKRNALQVHVFWSPNNATEIGLTTLPPDKSQAGFNAAMMHGLRGSTDNSEWILISVPAIMNGFVAMDADGIEACLLAANIGSKSKCPDLSGLRLSAHSRGADGLAQSLVAPKTKTPVKPLPADAVDRVVIFDAAKQVDNVLASSAIPGDKQFAYQVNDWTKLSKQGATNVQLSANAVLAIGYCRLIADAAITGPVAGAVVPPFQGKLLTLPARGKFTTRKDAPSTMTKLDAFAKVRANKKLIDDIIGDQLRPSGMWTFINANNLTRMFYGSRPFPPGILAHHLFVAELAHEIVD